MSAARIEIDIKNTLFQLNLSSRNTHGRLRIARTYIKQPKPNAIGNQPINIINQTTLKIEIKPSNEIGRVKHCTLKIPFRTVRAAIRRLRIILLPKAEPLHHFVHLALMT